MSDLELERATMAPRRWIELCCEFHEEDSYEYDEMLYPRTTRIFEQAANYLFIVPGGRYLVAVGRGIFVWDMGYVSTADCKLVASADGLGDVLFFKVQTTPDGKGLVILFSR